MGIGNLTELTGADSTGVNAVLIAVCQELGVRAVLTTEVIPWARGAVREIDVARRLMHYAVSQRTIPKGVDDRLRHGEGPGGAGVRRGRAARAAGRRSPIRTSGSSPTATRSPSSTTRLRPGRRHPGDLRAARRGRAGARLLSRQGAGAGEARGDAGQDLPPGRRAGLGISDAAGRREIGAREADARRRRGGGTAGQRGGET